jgi:peroxiredoxin
VGLGTQDDARQARQFVERYELEHTMLWDESFESWLQLGVRGQPAGMLFAADGTLIDRWSGPIPEGEVLEALGIG